MKLLAGIVISVFIVCFAFCTYFADTKTLSYEIIDKYPHDPEAFTQGLIWHDGLLYEGTGLYGRSSLRQVDLKTGIVLKKISLPAEFFGEGITIFNNRIYQLTWKSNIGFIYDLDSFQQLETFSYSHEGWGITHDGKRLIISDGTPVLHFIDPFTFKETGHIRVYEKDKPIYRINELEFVKGNIYANIWQSNKVAIIDPGTGQILAWLDLTDILKQEDICQKVDVLNGIAYDMKNEYLFITGKLWPKIFQIKIIQ